MATPLTCQQIDDSDWFDPKDLIKYLNLELAILQFRYEKYFPRKHHNELINLGLMIFAVKIQVELLTEISTIIES